MPRTHAPIRAHLCIRRISSLAIAVGFAVLTMFGSADAQTPTLLPVRTLTYPATGAPSPLHLAQTNSQLPMSGPMAVWPDESTTVIVSDEDEPIWIQSPATVYEPWTWQILPQGLIYSSYLAAEKESRFRSYWSHLEGHGWIWDITLGGRVGLIRHGSSGDARPTGWQLDIEGAGIPRLDTESDRDLMSADFRFGIPLTYGTETFQTKFAYYHLSSHLGDEFLLANAGYPRLNYSRDVLVLGQSYYPHDNLRLYAEAGWAFNSDVAELWEFQFGVDYAPTGCTGFHGAPFVALNGALRQEVDYGGNVVVQAGWAWRSSPVSGLLRTGFEYFQGKSDQFSFYDETESKAGIGIWYDF